MKPYLVFMAGKNSLEDIKELVEPIKTHIRGVCALMHDCDDNSPESLYLKSLNMSLGGGKIIFGEYVNDHAHSRNRIFKETGIEEGDYLCILDTLERVALPFAEKFQFWIFQMINQGIDVIRYYSKPYMVRYREDFIYIGTPHEVLVVLSQPPLKEIELNNLEKDESKVRVNMRPLKRDKNHHIDHYVRYLLQPNSNQNLLGLEHHGDARAFARLEFLRKSLVRILKEAGLPRTCDGVKILFSKPLNENVRMIINEHGQINNFYRYHILKQEVKDTHDWSNLPQF